MTSDNPLGEFLHARRDLVAPEDVGLSDNGRRRVPGLRREELAMLAGVSPVYYVRLEQGRDRHPSPQVVDALARVLQLEEDATAHLHELARAEATRPAPDRRPERVRPELERLLAAQLDTPAFVLGRRLDVLAANDLAAVLNPSFAPGRNLVRDLFLDAGTAASFVELDQARANAVGSLRAAAGAEVDDPRLVELVGELTIKCPEFCRLWARHGIQTKTSGSKRFRHPLVGELTLDYESFTIGGARDQQLVVYHAARGSDADRALTFAAQMAGAVVDSTTEPRRA